MRRSRGPQSQETKDKISAAHRKSGHRPDPSVVDLDRARQARWNGHVRDKIGILMTVYRCSARRRKVSFNLTREEFEIMIGLPCYYCGSPPSERTINAYRTTLVCSGIDRVDNSKGYVLDNCVPACKTCNIAKAALDQLAFIAHCKRVADRHSERY